MQLRLRHERLLVVIFIAMSPLLIAGCAGRTSYEDLVPKSMTVPKNTMESKGTISVNASVIQSDSGPYKINVPEWLDNERFRTALEKTIIDHGLFSKGETGGSDYVLDVVLDSIKSDLNVFGEGFMVNMNSIWRLTHTRDGKVLVCDFVKTRGASRAFANRAHKFSLVMAVQETIKTGVQELTDDTVSHMSAMSGIAGCILER